VNQYETVADVASVDGSTPIRRKMFASGRKGVRGCTCEKDAYGSLALTVRHLPTVIKLQPDRLDVIQTDFLRICKTKV
jgi:hypothetical protein